MAIIIDQGKADLSGLVKNRRIIDFIEYSISVAKNLSVGEFKRIDYSDELFSIAQHIVLIDRLDAVYESHKKYYDVHIPARGVESIDLLPIENAPEPYECSDEDDYCLYRTDLVDECLILGQNKMAVFKYNDLHKTGIKNDIGDNSMIKVVLKVSEDAFEREFTYG